MTETTKPIIECTPTRWRILDEWYPQYGIVAGGVEVQERRNRDGNTCYAVVLRSSWELSKSGDVSYMPIPSERSERYLSEHRWSKLDDAIAAAQIFAERCLEGGAVR